MSDTVVMPKEWHLNDIKSALAIKDGAVVVQELRKRKTIYWDINGLILNLPDGKKDISLRQLVHALTDHGINPTQIVDLLNDKRVQVTYSNIYPIVSRHTARKFRAANASSVVAQPTAASTTINDADGITSTARAHEIDFDARVDRELSLAVHELRIRANIRKSMKLRDDEFNSLPTAKEMMDYLLSTTLASGIIDINLLMTGGELLGKGVPRHQIDESLERHTGVFEEGMRWLGHVLAYTSPKEDGTKIYTDFLEQLIHFRRGNNPSNTFFRDFDKRFAAKDTKLPEVNPRLFPKLPDRPEGSPPQAEQRNSDDPKP